MTQYADAGGGCEHGRSGAAPFVFHTLKVCNLQAFSRALRRLRICWQSYDMAYELDALHDGGRIHLREAVPLTLNLP